MCGARAHVRFTPNSDRESEIPQKAMSALPPKADMCGAARDVRFGPKADITHSITSSACASSDGPIVSPNAFAVLRFRTNSNLVGRSIGMSAGLAPLETLSNEFCLSPIEIRQVVGTITVIQGVMLGTRGKITLISVNSPGCVSTSIEPPCCLTMMS